MHKKPNTSPSIDRSFSQCLVFSSFKSLQHLFLIVACIKNQTLLHQSIGHSASVSSSLALSHFQHLFLRVACIKNQTLLHQSIDHSASVSSSLALTLSTPVSHSGLHKNPNTSPSIDRSFSQCLVFSSFKSLSTPVSHSGLHKKPNTPPSIDRSFSQCLVFSSFKSLQHLFLIVACIKNQTLLHQSIDHSASVSSSLALSHFNTCFS